MPSTKKLTVYRTKQFLGPRRAKPGVRSLNQEIAKRIADEHSLIQDLIHDAKIREGLWLGMRGPLEPLVVYTDFDHSSLLTRLDPTQLPKWKDIGEYLKMHLLFLTVLEFGGYSFTVRVRPDLEAKWKAEGTNPMDRIRREVSKALGDQNLGKLEFCYVVETKGRSGAGRVPIHLHGFFGADGPGEATRFKVAMERALAAHPQGRAAAGIKPKSGPAILIEKCYEPDVNGPRGGNRWVTYITKNATKWDDRFRRRFFMSRSGTQVTQGFWELLRTDSFE